MNQATAPSAEVDVDATVIEQINWVRKKLDQAGLVTTALQDPL